MRDARTGIPASFPLAITDTGIMETTFNILQDGHLETLRRQAHALIDLLSETSRMHAPTIEKKAAKALQFSVKKDAESLAIPSKVRGVSQYQDAVHRIVKQREAGRLRTVSMGRLEQVSEKRFAVQARTASGTFHYVGYIHTKHTGWIAELAQHGPIDCYILQANGKDRKGYTGLSIAFTHVGEALGRWAAAQDTPDVVEKPQIQTESTGETMVQPAPEPEPEATPTKHVSIAAVTICSTALDKPQIGGPKKRNPNLPTTRKVKRHTEPEMKPETEPNDAPETASEQGGQPPAESGSETGAETTVKTGQKTDPSEAIKEREQEVLQTLEEIENEMADLFGTEPI